ncbi:MAG: hypothetical protein U5N85_02390 [Arcicella sp.]|nr:hypothetical protein [Arcicella sp.]
MMGKLIWTIWLMLAPTAIDTKGSDLGTYLNANTDFIRFYNPREDIWNEHFEIDNAGQITGKTLIGIATTKIFAFNHADRIIERRILIELGLWGF